MNENISILIPTRERPLQLERLIASIEQNTSNIDKIEIILYIDEDDPSIYELSKYKMNIKSIVGKCLSMGEYNSICYQKSCGDIIILLNDDVVIRTKNWDDIVRKITEKYPDNVYLAYGNDLYKGRKISTFPILTRKVCNLMNSPFPVEYKGALIDYHIFDIFKRLEKKGYYRIIYIPELIFEHMHFRAGKAKMDNTYLQRNRFIDDKVFINLTELRSKQAKSIISTLNGNQYSDIKSNYYLIRNKKIKYNYYHLIKIFLFNHELPLKWRSYLFLWFTLRQIAKKIYFKKIEYNRA